MRGTETPLQFAGKTADINGSKYPVYTLSFQWNSTPTTVKFSNKVSGNQVSTSELTFTEGAYYDFKNGGNVITTPAIENYIPTERTIYYIDYDNYGAENIKVHI